MKNMQPRSVSVETFFSYKGSLFIITVCINPYVMQNLYLNARLV